MLADAVATVSPISFVEHSLNSDIDLDGTPIVDIDHIISNNVADADESMHDRHFSSDLGRFASYLMELLVHRI